MTAAGTRPLRETDPLAIRLIAWLETCDIVQGVREPEPFRVLPFQEEFIWDFCEADIASLSVARGNGKTTLLGGICAAALSPSGPLTTPHSEIPLAAVTIDQAKITMSHCLNFLAPDMAANPGLFKVVDNTNEGAIINRAEAVKLQAVSSNPKSSHGGAPKLVVMDEPAQWPMPGGLKQFNALKGGLGKVEDARCAVIGTRPDHDGHFFSSLLESELDPETGMRTFGRVYSAALVNDDDWDSIDRVKEANPAWDYLPVLRKAVFSEIAAVRAGTLSKEAFMAYRLNAGTPETFDREFVLGNDSVAQWKACEVADPSALPPREGPLFLGLDIGQHRSLTAAAMYWPVSGRFEVRAALPASPKLAQRSLDDGVPGQYEAMEDRGELWVFPGAVTPVPQFIERLLAWLDGCRPQEVILDSFKRKECEHAFIQTGCGWQHFAEWRRVGRGEHGHQDIGGFSGECLEGHLCCEESLLMRSALRDAVIIRDSNQNPALDKRRKKGRIDPMQAAILAVAAGRRWRRGELGSRKGNVASNYVLDDGLL